MSVAKQRLAVYIAVGVLGVVLCGGVIRAQRSRRLTVSTPAKDLNGYQLGEQYRNRLDMSLRLRMSRAPEQELHLTGDLLRTPADIHEQFVEVAYEIERAQVSFKGADPGGAEQQRAEQELAAGLSHRFYVRHRFDGAVAAIEFERGLNPAFVNVLLTLVGTAQWVEGSADQSAWTAIEKDTNGDYLAAYARTGPGRATKRILRYLNQAQAQQGASAATPSLSVKPEATIEQAAFDVVASEHGRLKEMQGSEQTKVTLSALGLSMHTTITLNLSACTIQKNPGVVGDYALYKENYVLQPMENAAEDPRIRRAYEDRSVLHGATFAQVWAELSVLPKPTDASQTSSVVRRLEALFRLEDSSIRGTLQRLPDTAESNGKLALDALSLAQTDEAQDALAEVAQGPAYSALHREYAIRYLGHQQAPTAASLAALRLLVDDRDPKRRQLARLAYGTLAARVASKQPEQSHQMVQCLIDRLRTASDDSERADLQLALGNSASRQAFSPLRDATMKHTGVLRATAIEAVGNIDDPAVVPLLGDLLKSEQVEVRMAALNGVQRRELGPFLPALVEIAKRDKSAHVRSAAVELLGSQLASVPQLRDVLAECSKDSDMKVRNAAMRQLSLIARPRAG